jgi:hypothetical protein
MTDVDTLSGQPLDDLMAQFMGWHRGYSGYWAWGEHSGDTYMDFSGPSIARWHPSRGKSLSAAASDVLLKALADGLDVEMIVTPSGYVVDVAEAPTYLAPHMATAPTLPLALCRAIAKMMEAKEA